MDERIRPSLARPWHQPCLGHTDFYGDYLVWTRHYPVRPWVSASVVRYDQVAPERVPKTTVLQEPADAPHPRR